MSRLILTALADGLLAGPAFALSGYPIVDTNQDDCYDTLQVISPPAPGEPFFGQDAQFDGNQPSYRDNGDGTVADLVTGLTWVQARGEKMSWYDAVDGASACRVEGYDDWRTPTIKELYSLIDFTGFSGASAYDAKPYIDTSYFGFRYGDTTQGERYIDCQDWSATLYVGTVMVGDSGVFGVNFADGRIKGYPTTRPQPPSSPNLLYVRYVRGNPDYGVNDLFDRGDGTVYDSATGLMWSKADSDSGLNWRQALAWTQDRNDENWLGYSDWRLPNAKELQGVVDYTRSPAARNPAQRGPAIDTAHFDITAITNEQGEADYPWLWTSTSHLDGPADHRYTQAVYVTFGRAHGWMRLPGNQYYSFLDVHGAGAQRSDPKTGDVTSYPLGYDSLGNPVYGRGPQGDGVRIRNHVRLVRYADQAIEEGRGTPGGRSGRLEASPNPFNGTVLVHWNLARDADVNLRVFDASGRVVRILAAGPSIAGTRTTTWNGRDDTGRELAPGIYFVRLETPGETVRTRVTLAR